MEIAHTTGSLDLRPDAPTLRAFVEDTFKPLYRTKFRPGTWKRYEGILSQGLLVELGDLHVDAIGSPVVRAFMAFLGKREIQSRGPVNLLRTLLTAAVETGVLEAMPELPKAPPPGKKLPSAPSTDEVDAMLANAKGWLRVAVALGALAGLRQGEVRALQVRDVDLKQGIITVRWALSENELVAPKSGDERVVPIGAPLAEVMAQALRGKLPAARVVLNRRGRTPSRQAVLSALKKVQLRHGLNARSFHSLRHYFLSALVRGGANLEAVRELAGHSKLLTTQRYVHATGADLRDAIGRLPGN
ncbi:MAG TPA: tyrosine-type recombinase/integrase [Polyangiaceae bacterium]|nr:tyrosine-type recombinase/integrase [Polyangiaceae bacterium]